MRMMYRRGGQATSSSDVDDDHVHSANRLCNITRTQCVAQFDDDDDDALQ